jgi:hypothetical protein
LSHFLSSLASLLYVWLSAGLFVNCHRCLALLFPFNSIGHLIVVHVSSLSAVGCHAAAWMALVTVSTASSISRVVVCGISKVKSASSCSLKVCQFVLLLVSESVFRHCFLLKG